ncbi:unnamed protein product [Somion occarium]|uniref:FK506-binding protein n=1 Tax=Somion occarium TaxID=3059160 RepID=A0ABP1DIP2_9APHY
MPLSFAIWSAKLTPGEPEAITPPADLRITNIALGDEVAEENARTSVRLVYMNPAPPEDSDDEDDEEEKDEDEDDEDSKLEPVQTFLGSVTPGKVEQCMVDITLGKDEEILLEAVGKNVVYVTGNYIDQGGNDSDDESNYDYDPDEDDYDLQDIPSDVEVDADEIELLSEEGRFEEVNEESTAAKTSKDSKKRPREPDAMETEEPKLSKSQQKKLNKKLKAEGGNAVPTGEESAPPATEAKKEKKDKKEKKEKKEKEEDTKKPVKVEERKDGLKIEDHKVGTGPQAKKGDKVSLRYIGKLTNGKEFDKNVSGKPFIFRLGRGEVIKGWDEGIAGMQVGGERRLTIPASLGYGKKGSDPIPPNATLIFDVKLVKIN